MGIIQYGRLVLKDLGKFLRDPFMVKPEPEPARRRIVRVEGQPDGRELWVLECGHEVLVTKHRMTSIPCRACEEAGK